MWSAAGKGVRLPRHGGKPREIGSAPSARTTIGVLASGVTGNLAPPIIGVANVATSILAAENFAIGLLVAGPGRSIIFDGVVQRPVYSV